MLHVMESVGSTSDEARHLAEAGAPHGEAVMARHQTAGRGRQGRAWVSPPGNLHLSVVLRPDVAPARVPELALVAALAVADAADGLLGRAATTLKWPNDVQVDGAKLAGILLEQLEGGAVIAGIGMNLAHSPPGLPYPTTSMAQLGTGIQPAAAANAVLTGLAMRWAVWRDAGFGVIRDAWMQRGPAVGTALRVRQGLAWLDGRYAGLDLDGAMLLDGPTGRQRIVAGEVA